MINRYHLDKEVRSKCDLKKTGVYRYAEDPSTEVLMASIRKNNGKSHLWVNPKFESPLLKSDPEAEILLKEGTSDPTALWYAWNAQFERAVSRSRMFLDMGLIPPEPKQWRCVMAMSMRAALPAKLATAARMLGVTEKDTRGSYYINKFCKPTKEGEFRDPCDPKNHQHFKEFGDYCLTDNDAETEIHEKLKAFEMTGSVLETYQLDSVINDRGLPVNVPALQNAQRILDEVFAELNDRFYQATGLMQTQNKAVKELLHNLGVDVEDLKGDTVKAALLAQETALSFARECGDGESIDKFTRNVNILRLYGTLNFAAAKKVTAMLNCVCSDGRVRGTLLYHGAGTGRWSGRLIQPQNFKRPTIKDTATAYQMICDGCSREELELIFGNPLEVIASCIRHFIQWGEGMMFDADYAQVEARIVCWLAGQEDVLEIFRKSDAWKGAKKDNPIDIYKDMAREIYNKAFKDITDDERTVGKHTILGCGFAMWWPKFIETCAKFGVVVTEELAQKAVNAYRKMCHKVVQLWDDVEQAAKAAINNPGKAFMGGKHLRFTVATTGGIPFLVMRLPSGRNIVYPYPKLEWSEYPAKDEKGNQIYNEEGLAVYRKRLSITFFGQIEGKQIWGRIKTYGGKLVENATQGTAADFMAHGSVTAEARGHIIATLIHDQALGLALPGLDIKGFCEALMDIPKWAFGCPIKAEGKVVPYYTKS